MPDDFLRVLASWALLHELADDAWKAAVARGRGEASGAEDDIGGGSHLDALAALVAEEKDRLREALASGELATLSPRESEAMESLRFEVGEMRARLEAIETSLDAISRKLDAG